MHLYDNLHTDRYQEEVQEMKKIILLVLVLALMTSAVYAEDYKVKKIDIFSDLDIDQRVGEYSDSSCHITGISEE